MYRIHFNFNIFLCTCVNNDDLTSFGTDQNGGRNVHMKANCCGLLNVAGQ